MTDRSHLEDATALDPPRRRGRRAGGGNTSPAGVTHPLPHRF